MNVGIMALTCGFAAVGASPALGGVAPPVPLRIVTWNVLQGVGSPGSFDAQQIGAVATILDQDGAGPNTGLVPDILMLQEVNQAAVGDIFSFRDTYLPGYDLRTATGDGFNFNATLTRPGITVISHASLAVGGPRGVGKTKVRVPGALNDTWLYNAHFKSGSATADRSQRTGNANASGNNVSFEVNFGGGANVIFGGDLNSNNNSDGTITGLFFTSTNPMVSSGILNLPVESLAGAANPGITAIVTFPSSGSRLDYICLDNQLASAFDADMNGTYNQAELNSMGFVYYSADDAGLRSNGNANATSNSDHRPVVFDIRLPRDSNIPSFEPSDLNQDGAITVEDLQTWESRFALTAPPQPSPAPDIDGDRNVDPADRDSIRAAVRAGEAGDITVN